MKISHELFNAYAAVKRDYSQNVVSVNHTLTMNQSMWNYYAWKRL